MQHLSPHFYGGKKNPFKCPCPSADGCTVSNPGNCHTIDKSKALTCEVEIFALKTYIQKLTTTKERKRVGQHSERFT